jgi:DNA-binding MarR family transcriptional regulator
LLKVSYLDGQDLLRDILMVKRHAKILQKTRNLYEAMHRFDVSAAEELGLHVTDLRCVNALENGPLSAGEIGSRLALTSGSVTALINRLVAGGFAKRVEDPADGRRSVIALTPKFWAEADRIYGRLGVAIEKAFSSASAPERTALASALERLAIGFSTGTP